MTLHSLPLLLLLMVGCAGTGTPELSIYIERHDVNSSFSSSASGYASGGSETHQWKDERSNYHDNGFSHSVNWSQDAYNVYGIALTIPFGGPEPVRETQYDHTHPPIVSLQPPVIIEKKLVVKEPEVSNVIPEAPKTNIEEAPPELAWWQGVLKWTTEVPLSVLITLSIVFVIVCWIFRDRIKKKILPKKEEK